MLLLYLASTRMPPGDCYRRRSGPMLFVFRDALCSSDVKKSDKLSDSVTAKVPVCGVCAATVKPVSGCCNTRCMQGNVRAPRDWARARLDRCTRCKVKAAAWLTKCSSCAVKQGPPASRPRLSSNILNTLHSPHNCALPTV